jgi:hypothetical protein
VDAPFLGRALLEACLPQHLDPKDAATRAWAAETVALLAAGLAKEPLRPVAAEALGGIGGSGFGDLAEYRAALDRLAERADDPACLAALAATLPRVYGRPEAARSCGQDPGAWRAYVARDRQRLDAWNRHGDWLKANAAGVMRVLDGKERLAEANAYLAKAQAELDGWVKDAAFIPPLGVTRSEVEERAKLVRSLAMQVRDNLAGARGGRPAP